MNNNNAQSYFFQAPSCVSSKPVQAYAQSTPAQSYAQSTPAQSYAKSTPDQTYVQSTPAQGYVPYTPAQGYVPNTPAQGYVPNSFSQGYVPNSNAFQRERVSGLAVASMVVGIIGLLCSTGLNMLMIPYFLIVMALLAVLFSISPIRRHARGRGMAIAGLVLGLITFARVVLLWGQIESMF